MSKILGIHDKEAIEAMLSHIESECKKVDTDEAYDDMLDDCFSFASVGGIFSHMSPSYVLKECDPTAYRCGKNDWLDAERDTLVEVRSDDYYRVDDVDTAKEEFIDGLNDELAELEGELSNLELETDDGGQSRLNEIDKIKDSIERKQSAIEACENYAF